MISGKRTILALLVSLAVLPAIHAQIAPAAPIPRQIVTAKKIFIANSSEQHDDSRWSGGPTRAYNELYAAFQGSGRYQLVSTPADAGMVVQISLFIADDSHFWVVLIDPKTHITLWTMNTAIEGGILKSIRDKKYNESIHEIVNNIKALADSGHAM